jgi:hypothetical protein
MGEIQFFRIIRGLRFAGVGQKPDLESARDEGEGNLFFTVLVLLMGELHVGQGFEQVA